MTGQTNTLLLIIEGSPVGRKHHHMRLTLPSCRRAHPALLSDARLGVPAKHGPLGDGSGPLERLEGPRQRHRLPTPGLRSHQIARVDLKGSWVSRGHDPHERQLLGWVIPKAEDRLSVDR